MSEIGAKPLNPAQQAAQRQIDSQNAEAEALRESDPQRSLLLSERAYALCSAPPFSAQPYRKGQAAALLTIGLIHQSAARFDRALAALLPATEIFERLDNAQGAALAGYAAGHCLWNLGNYPDALSQALRSLEHCEKYEGVDDLANALNLVGLVCAANGEYYTSLTYFQRVLELSRVHDQHRRIGSSLNNLSMSYMNLGDYPRALELAQQAVQFTSQSDEEGQPNALDTLGEVQMAMGERLAALESFRLALRRAESVWPTGRQQRLRASVLRRIGEVYLALEEPLTSLPYLEESLELARNLDMKAVAIRCLQNLAQACKALGDYQQSLEYFEVYHRLEREDIDGQYEMRRKSQEILNQVDETRRSIEHYRQHSEMLEKEILRRRQAESQLRLLAELDGLTGLLNRRAFFEQGERLLRRAQEDNAPLCAIMIDLDHFKEINDHYGHATGDEALRRAAHALSKALRDGDLLGRYGGEEFAVLLPNANLGTSEVVAERLRKALDELRIQSSGGEKEVRLSCSVGLAAATRPAGELPSGSSLPQLEVILEWADTALYAAKLAGRNRVQVYKHGLHPHR